MELSLRFGSTVEDWLAGGDDPFTAPLLEKLGGFRVALQIKAAPEIRGLLEQFGGATFPPWHPASSLVKAFTGLFSGSQVTCKLGYHEVQVGPALQTLGESQDGEAPALSLASLLPLPPLAGIPEYGKPAAQELAEILEGLTGLESFTLEGLGAVLGPQVGSLTLACEGCNPFALLRADLQRRLSFV